MATKAITYTPNPTTESEFMDIREFAARLGISLTVAYEQARANTLPVPAHRAGRQFRFSRRAYDDLTRAQHGQGRDAA